nr:adenylate kinase [Saccharopolyspora spinosa]
MPWTETSRTTAEANQDVPRRVILIGPPGAGKGTQTHTLATHLGVAHISTGDLFRRHVGGRTVLGERAQTFMVRGELVPNEITLATVRNRLAEGDAAGGFLLDGFPRTVEQAVFLQQLLRQSGTGIDAVLEMHVEEDEIVRRLAGRRTCRECGRSWHVEFDPPRAEGSCDACGGALAQRDDDREEAIRRRLDLYEQETRPLLDFFRERGLLVRIDARGPVAEVGERAISAVGTTDHSGRS